MHGCVTNLAERDSRRSIVLQHGSDAILRLLRDGLIRRTPEVQLAQCVGLAVLRHEAGRRADEELAYELAEARPLARDVPIHRCPLADVAQAHLFSAGLARGSSRSCSIHSQYVGDSCFLLSAGRCLRALRSADGQETDIGEETGG
jgi:hypothetical protein